MDRNDKTKELFEQLKGRGEAFTSGERFQAFLKSMAKFHRYSANNQFLIWIQYPEASHVNAYRRWQELGRQVRKGERGIRILAPIPFTYTADVVTPTGPETKEFQGVRFKSVAVFAYEQTDPIEGHPTPPWEPLKYPVLDGDTGEEAFQQTVAYFTRIGIPTILEDGIEGAHGYFHPGNGTIHVDRTHPPLYRLHVMLHEGAHALHWTKYKKEDEFFPRNAYREIVAEASAYVIAEAIGIDTSEHADMYVGANMYRATPEEIEAALPVIQKISHELIDMLTAPVEEAVAA